MGKPKVPKRDFIPNREYGKNRKRLNEDIADASLEGTKRHRNNVDAEDQDAHVTNLKEVRGRLN